MFQKDGEIVESGDVLVDIDGPANQILTFERVILNLTQRLCGISTETDKYCKLNLPEGFKVMDTRKTTPGLKKVKNMRGLCWRWLESSFRFIICHTN